LIVTQLLTCLEIIISQAQGNQNEQLFIAQSIPVGVQPVKRAPYQQLGIPDAGFAGIGPE
jgi:hypothetical protein